MEVHLPHYITDTFEELVTWEAAQSNTEILLLILSMYMIIFVLWLFFTEPKTKSK